MPSVCGSSCKLADLRGKFVLGERSFKVQPRIKVCKSFWVLYRSSKIIMYTCVSLEEVRAALMNYA